ncbi:hypothetical protein K1T71_014861 [Dendrolimus kikuchii]|nr:hypothetical protein K1T71_014861 [Dendrolimus kikuchii]
MVQTRRNASVKDETNLPKVPAVTAKNIVTVDVHTKPMTVPLESGSIKSEIPVGNKMNVSRQCASLSRKSSSSIEARRKRLELQAAEAKARINMDLIEKRLAADIADLEDEKYSSHSEGNHSQHGNVEEWLERSQHELEAQADPRDGTDTNDGTVHILASALKDLAAASSSNNSNAQMLSRLCTPRDLPAYSGDPLEWLQFKQAFEESTRVCNFSDQENLWRLRKCLLGPAKDAVTALLISATSPTVVMSTLELQFGNPDIIISKIMYDIKKLPPVSPEYHKDIISFSIKVKNYVAAVLAIGQEEYLKGTNVTSIILSKLPTVLISKWADYSFKLIQEGMPLQITQGTPNGPYLTRTPLGWCVHGCVSTLQEGPHSMLFLSGSGVDGDSRESEKESLHDLHETVRQSFSIEAMGVSRMPCQNSEHVKATEHLERTSIKIQDLLSDESTYKKVKTDPTDKVTKQTIAVMKKHSEKLSLDLMAVVDEFSPFLISGTATTTVNTGKMHINLTSDVPVSYHPYPWLFVGRRQERGVRRAIISRFLLTPNVTSEVGSCGDNLKKNVSYHFSGNCVNLIRIRFFFKLAILNHSQSFWQELKGDVVLCSFIF